MYLYYFDIFKNLCNLVNFINISKIDFLNRGKN